MHTKHRPVQTPAPVQIAALNPVAKYFSTPYVHSNANINSIFRTIINANTSFLFILTLHSSTLTQRTTT
jgi:hypothetical protein